MSNHSVPGARALFEKQIDCIRKDDREEQLRLYTEDCVYDFPFATDRPRHIVGREAIAGVMNPLWTEARRLGVKVTDCDARLFETTDPSQIIAEFTLTVAIADKTLSIPFIQFVKSRSGLIAEMREYFSPQARSAITPPA